MHIRSVVVALGRDHRARPIGHPLSLAPRLLLLLLLLLRMCCCLKEGGGRIHLLNFVLAIHFFMLCRYDMLAYLTTVFASLTHMPVEVARYGNFDIISTSFQAIFHGVLIFIPPHTRRGVYSSKRPCLLDAD